MRQASGLSIAQLGALAHVPTVVVGSYERGDRSPTLETLDELFTAMGYEIITQPKGLNGPGAIRTIPQMVTELHAIAARLGAHADDVGSARWGEADG